MKTRKTNPINGSIKKECAFCGEPFYTKTDKAKYCSDSHKVQFSQMVKKSHQWYSHDPNEGKVLPSGTLTSWEMPENKLVLTGDLASLYSKLAAYVTPEQLSKEEEYIETLKPFSETKEWTYSGFYHQFISCMSGHGIRIMRNRLIN
jgi:hypothetical protein